MLKASVAKPVWYRDATARYSENGIRIIHEMGYRVAGYSLNADMGASLMAGLVEKRIAAAKDGDVIIAHINQPGRVAGAGVAKGVLALQQKGFRFVRLQDVTASDQPVRSGV
jgi:peptidoglycan/xylan/chitin deacetylase (PgdA/CDA1 family)